MGIILRQRFINLLYLNAGALIGIINVIWLFPFVLEAEQFGLTRVLISISIIGAQLVTIGINSGAQHFFPKHFNPGKHHFWYLVAAVTFPLFGFLFLSLAGWIYQSPIIQFYSDKSALFGDYYQLLFLLLLFIIYYVVLEGFIRSLFHTVTAIFFREVLLRLLQTAVVLSYFFGWITFGSFMWLFVLSYAVQSLLMLVFIGIHHRIFDLPDENIYPFGRKQPFTDFALFFFPGTVIVVTLGNIDMLMVGGFTTLGETAVYAVGFYLACIIITPSKRFLTRSRPLLAASRHKNDLPAISDIYSKSSINQLLAGGTLFILIWLNIEHIYRILPAEYHAGDSVFLYTGLAVMISMITGLNAAIIRTFGWHLFELFATALLIILMVGTNMLLIPIYGITGAAIATAISLFIYKSICLCYVRFRLGMQPLGFKTLSGLLLLLAAGVAAVLIPEISYWFLDAAVRSILAVGVIVCGILLFHISTDLEQIIKKLPGNRNPENAG